MLDRLRRIPALHGPIWLYLALIAIALAIGLPLCRRAIILSDEGYLLQQSLDLLQGRVIYRDMDAFITPGVWFLLAGVFSVFGPSVWVSRMVILVAYVALCLVTFRIVEVQTSRVWGLAAVGSLLIFSVWAFPAWTFAFYSPFSVLFALLALERLLAWDRMGRRRDLLLTGALLGLSICFKQNYGVFATLGAAMGYAAMRLERSREEGRASSLVSAEISLVAGGVLAAALPFVLYLLWHGAIPHAWQSLVVHPFEFAGRHDIPYASLSDLWRADLYKTAIDKLTYLSYSALNAPLIVLLHPFRLVHRLHTLAYFIAPLVFVCAMGVSFLVGRSRGGRIDARLFATTTTCGLLFLGVLPRADFNHLVNVYQGVLVTLPIVLHHAFAHLGTERRPARWAIAAVVGSLAMLYGGIAIHWYTSLIRSHDTPLESPRAGVLVRRLMADEIDHQVRTIERNTKPGEAVLTVPDLVMLNFLADRKVPSPYYNLYEHHIAQSGGQPVIDGSEMHGVELVVTRFDNFFSDRVGLLEYAPGLANYIVTHFRRVFISSNESFVIYRRREKPETQHPFVNVLSHCSDDDPLAEIRSHLLFSALYHKSKPDQPIPESGVESRCRVVVPAGGGVLSLEIGYRKPYIVERGTRLHARILVESEGEQEVVVDEWLRVVRRGASKLQQPYHRIAVDLTRYRGREIELVFETALEGSVQIHPLDFKGFAMIFRDPRVQHRSGGARP